MVLIPDLVTAATKEDGTLDLGLWKAIQTSLISHCEQYTNRMAILDSPPGMTAQQIKEWRSETAMYDSAFAAMYYPWVKVENPVAPAPTRRSWSRPAATSPDCGPGPTPPAVSGRPRPTTPCAGCSTSSGRSARTSRAC